MLAVALGGDPWHIRNLDVKAIGALCDQVNLMTYDLQAEGVASHHTPLYGASESYPQSVDLAVRSYVEAGLPRSKIMIGAAFYGRSFTLKTLLDSGHTLTEPATNRPVLVADWRALAPCLPAGLRADDPVSGMALCRAAGVRGQLIPYRAVGVERGLLLALRSDGVRVDGREQGELLVALSPTPVDGGEGIQALLGAWEDRGPAQAPGPHRHGRERKA